MKGSWVKQDQRAPFVAALERAREAAYPSGEYVGQESFVLADEIRELAGRAGIGPGVSVLDVGCGVAGPGRLIPAEMTDLLADVGLTITWQSECTKFHAATAAALLDAYRGDAARIADHVGARGLDELVAAHELWADWLSSGRIRKFAIVAEKL